MFVLKHIPEDFIVEEMLQLHEEEGPYSYYLLTKKNKDFFSTIEEICRMLKIQRKFINSAGIKDKKAVTKQYVSIRNGPKRNIETANFQLSFLHKGNERLNIGGLQGNKFTIIVRNIEKLPEKIISIPNYFDDQRFGANKDNHIIGRFLLQEKYDEAEQLIKLQNFEMTGRTPLERIRSMHKQRLQFYIHAYQSHLWNLAVARHIQKTKKDGRTIENLFFPKEEPEPIKVPIVGFMSELESPFEEIYNQLLAEDNLTQRSFLVRALGGMCIEGNERSITSTIKDLHISSLSEDEHHPGKKKCEVSFVLGKGSYATLVIKALFGEE